MFKYSTMYKSTPSILTFIVMALCHSVVIAQLYFPPVQGDTWQTVTPSSLGWNEAKIEELKTYLASVDSKAFLILKDGKIVVEHYMNGHSAEKNWYWASAGKSLTSTLVGIAAGEGKLDINSPSSLYLGKGWSSMTSAQEEKITVRHHITMTTGLDDSDFECTDPQCLKYLAEPGTRWSYHNAPYTLCDGIIEGATGKTLNAYFKDKIGEKTGMVGLFVKSGYNNVFYSNARTMARFGLLSLAKGNWDNKDIINNQSYISTMAQSSQSINPSYGYLWWLNGKEKFMLPSSQLKFNGSLIPNAPADMYSALGKNDQKIHVVPSL
jgi:CubicO group peptidase (beta-lactamase class C family)